MSGRQLPICQERLRFGEGGREEARPPLRESIDGPYRDERGPAIGIVALARELQRKQWWRSESSDRLAGVRTRREVRDPRAMREARTRQNLLRSRVNYDLLDHAKADTGESRRCPNARPHRIVHPIRASNERKSPPPLEFRKENTRSSLTPGCTVSLPPVPPPSRARTSE